MDSNALHQQMVKKGSALCVGLDIDLTKMPAHVPRTRDGVWDFLTQIIDATAPYAVAYKPNTAFFEALGPWGWSMLGELNQYIKDRHSDCLTIADAKRGDIGNTSAKYAQAFLNEMGYDAITVAPYMGHDSVQPFMLPGKYAVVLGLTSNPGAEDVELLPLADGRQVYQAVLEKIGQWGSADQLMVVMGATRPTYLSAARSILPNHFFLVPGVGAQGGDLEAVLQHGLNDRGGLLINASRSILYAGSGIDFANAAAAEAQRMQDVMHKYL
jgi:orotidine-5'-phosphate decarboxylase